MAVANQKFVKKNERYFRIQEDLAYTAVLAIPQKRFLLSFDESSK